MRFSERATDVEVCYQAWFGMGPRLPRPKDPRRRPRALRRRLRIPSQAGLHLLDTRLLAEQGQEKFQFFYLFLR